MENLRAIIEVTVNLLKFEFELFGYTLSWWNIMLWIMIASILIFVTVRFFK